MKRSEKENIDVNAKKQKVDLPQDWLTVLEREIRKDYFVQMMEKLTKESVTKIIYPPKQDWFSFMKYPIEKIQVVIIGQDPYHGEGQAHGLCFSVRKGIQPPPSLINIYKELEKDVEFKRPEHGYLEGWASQGVLLLNATLTVRKSEPNSHAKYGWAQFTDFIIAYLNKHCTNLVFMLWGGFAQKKAKNVDKKKHLVLTATHPSPLGANKGGWFGSKHFSKANEYLKEKGRPEIDWSYLP